MSWGTFIKAHLGVIVGMDFFTVEAMMWFGLVRYHVLFALDGFLSLSRSDLCFRSRASALNDWFCWAVVGNGAVAYRERIGGLLQFYHREAA